MLNDTISDLLTRIRNAMILKSDFVIISVNKVTCSILEIFKTEQFIKNFNFITIQKRSYLLVTLSYPLKKRYIARSLRRISKSSLQLFINKTQNFSKISAKMNLFSFFIISTSFGIMSHRTAKNLQIGGEILIQIELIP